MQEQKKWTQEEEQFERRHTELISILNLVTG